MCAITLKFRTREISISPRTVPTTADNPPSPRVAARGAGPLPPYGPLPIKSRTVVANIKSQIKRNRQNEKRHDRNKAVRSELKTRVKRALTAAEQGADDAADAARQAT